MGGGAIDSYNEHHYKSQKGLRVSFVGGGGVCVFLALEGIILVISQLLAPSVNYKMVFTLS